MCVDLVGEENRSSPLLGCVPSLEPAAPAGHQRGSLKPVDQFHRVGTPDPVAEKATKAEAEARREDAVHEENVRAAEAYWSAKAKEKD